jgi:predicted DsbA family dithiol-disulfide isomerase
MNIEIWSDIACPFCIIGKRQLEAALAQYPQRDNVHVTWHSFELDPNAKLDFGMDIFDVLSHKYGMSREEAITNNDRLSMQAKSLGLDFNMNKLIPTNSFNAHRLTHLANTLGLGNEVHELLFKAYFTEGKKISDISTLTAIGIQAGIAEEKVKSLFATDAFAYEVRQDEQEAQNIGVRGVPFFLIDRKYAISGAQGTPAFLEALTKIGAELKVTETANEGDVCSTDNPNC